MSTKLIKVFLVVGLVVVMCGFSLQASATTFSYSEESGFLVGKTGNLISTDPVTPWNDIRWYQLPGTPVAPPAGEYNTIGWGRSNGSAANMGANDPMGAFGNHNPPNINTDMSALRVLGQKGQVSTGAGGAWGNPVTISTLYHQNKAIARSYFTLENAIIASVLNITDGNLSSDHNNIPITFTETLNAKPCANPENGDPNQEMSVCDDYFCFNVLGFAPLTFTSEGKTYDVAFNLANFLHSKTDFPNCDANGVCTVWTAENVTSQMDVVMQIREEVVPEPATITLLGLGLFGLGLAVTRRKFKK